MENEKLTSILEQYKDIPGPLIPVLQEAQNVFGYLAPETLKGIARGLGIPFSHVFGTVTFYSQFYLQPRGEHTVKVCQGTACHVKGAPRILETLEDHLSVKAGYCTKDMQFELETVACLGTCFLSPVIMIDNDYYGAQTPKSVRKLIRKYADAEKKRVESKARIEK
jgi:NADH:ubiquinone oxidoreductase subunit E